MIGVTNNSPQQINAALIALKGEVKNEVKNEIINNIDNSVIGETYTAGDGIDITNDIISQTTDQLTFTGTQAQWNALTSAEKAKYGLVNITDDDDIIGYPLGYVYTQHYHLEGNNSAWEQTPIQLGLRVPSGCQWHDEGYSIFEMQASGSSDFTILITYNTAVKLTTSGWSWTATKDCIFSVSLVQPSNMGGYTAYVDINTKTIDSFTFAITNVNTNPGSSNSKYLLKQGDTIKIRCNSDAGYWYLSEARYESTNVGKFRKWKVKQS
jgi:hypothetical protein